MSKTSLHATTIYAVRHNGEAAMVVMDKLH